MADLSVAVTAVLWETLYSKFKCLIWCCSICYYYDQKTQFVSRVICCLHGMASLTEWNLLTPFHAQISDIWPAFAAFIENVVAYECCCNMTLCVSCCVFFCLRRNWGERRREWLLHEAKLFADELLKKWRLGHCTEDVIVLYSLDDGVVSIMLTSTG